MRNNKSNELDTMSVLQIIFIVLKLTNLINWSWWVVFIPFWVSMGVYAAALIIWEVYSRKHRRKKM